MSNEKDMSPVLTENKFTEFYNNHIYPYLNGATHDGCVPVGSVISYFGETAPRHYLICDGTAYNKTDYPELWTLLSSLTDTTPYVVSGDNTKFKVPDLRGEFLRGTGTNSHTNQGSGSNVGVHQNATTLPNMVHENKDTVTVSGWDDDTWASYVRNHDSIDSSITSSKLRYNFLKGQNDWTDNNNGSLKTSRPTNTSVLYCIAYKNIYIDAVIGGENTVITNPQEGQGLVYDATNGVWKNGAGGLHEYSTTEKVIGKWIDGRPVYERSFYVGNSGADTSVHTLTLAHGITNMDYCVNVSGFLLYPSTGQSLPISFYNPSVPFQAYPIIDRTNISITLNINARDVYIILQYVKTTDSTS